MHVNKPTSVKTNDKDEPKNSSENKTHNFMQIGGLMSGNGARGLLNELLLGGRDAGDLSHLHLDVLDGVATGDGKRERGSISFDEELHTCVVAKPSVPE
jgi:hypothetical protein